LAELTALKRQLIMKNTGNILIV